jgi:hypothetical protein
MAFIAQSQTAYARTHGIQGMFNLILSPDFCGEFRPEISREDNATSLIFREMSRENHFFLIYIYYSLHEHKVKPRGSQSQARRERKRRQEHRVEHKNGGGYIRHEATVRTVKDEEKRES